MPEPIFSDQRWRMRLYLQSEAILARYHWRGRHRIRMLIARTILSDHHYFQTDYAGSLRLWVCPRHVLGRIIAQRGAYERYTCALIQHFVQRGYAFIDVGANIGTHTVVAAKARTDPGTQRIAAFEPSPVTCQILRRNCQLNDQTDVQCVLAAVSDHAGQGILLRSTNNDPALMMTVEGTLAPESSAGDDKCVYVSLDDFCAETGWTEPTVVKIDVQGFEPRVFRGAHNAFGQMSDLLLIFEIDVPCLTSAGFSLDDLQRELNALSFATLYSLDEKQGSIRDLNPWQIVTQYADQRGYSNVLAVKGQAAKALLDEYIRQLPNLPANLQPRAQSR